MVDPIHHRVKLPYQSQDSQESLLDNPRCEKVRTNLATNVRMNRNWTPRRITRLSNLSILRSQKQRRIGKEQGKAFSVASTKNNKLTRRRNTKKELFGSSRRVFKYSVTISGKLRLTLRKVKSHWEEGS